MSKEVKVLVPLPAGISCGFLPQPDNGIVDYPDGDTLFESRAQYVCDAGYVPQGMTVRTCLANAVWSLSPPTCNRKSEYSKQTVHKAQIVLPHFFAKEVLNFSSILQL